MKQKHTLSLSKEAWEALLFVSEDIERPVSWIVCRLALNARSKIEWALEIMSKENSNHHDVERYHEALDELDLR